MSEKVPVVLDVGKSGVRAAASSAEGRRVATRSPGISPADPESAARLIRVAVSLVDEVAADHDVSALVIGSTAAITDDELDQLCRALRARQSVDTIAFADDGLVIHAATFFGEGTLLSVGTGVIAVTRSPDGHLDRVDGWGPLLGDLGGASWLGRELLARAYRQRDLGTDTAMVRFAERHLGMPLDLVFARDLLRSPEWPVTLADLGRHVLDSDGGPSIRELAVEGARHLVETAGIAADKAQSSVIALAGRLVDGTEYGRTIASLARSIGLDVRWASSPLDLDVEGFITSDYMAHPSVRVSEFG